LRHPNVAEIYEAGTHLGLPYFVMEYIADAQPITDYAEQHDLSTRDRLELFAQVCDAVHHGHQRGIIHRDLKPANILVDEAGRVKVIDFGVARATDADIALTTLRTETGQLIGTLQYMSPEQCDADPHELDVRSDVYSLGVVLYELLCGRLPYDVTRSALASAARVICEQPPPRPSSVTGKKRGAAGFSPRGLEKREGNRSSEGIASVDGSESGRRSAARAKARGSSDGSDTARAKVRGDLERIVLTALEKDRTRRYQSAADLLRDIRHYLNREPIEAKPPTLWTRAVRWTGRHPAWATAVTCMSIAALVFAATWVSVWWYNIQPAFIDRVTRTGEVTETSNGFEARLWSRSGRLLKPWRVPIGAKVTEARLVDFPEELGGGQRVLLSFANALSKYRYGNAVAAFDPAISLEEPLWYRAPEANEPMPIPPYDPDRLYAPHEFNAYIMGVWDVFTGPEHIGAEIVVVFNHKVYSQRILRIYDLEGRLLYQIWHDGGISECYWMTEAGLLVCVGNNGERRWDEWGWDFEGREHPRVVFAIRPEPDELFEQFLATSPGDGPLDPAWYYWLSPPEFLADPERPVEIRLVGPSKAKSGRAVGLIFRFWDETGKRRGGLGWDIDAAGREILDSRSIPDEYKSHLKNPPPDHLNRLPQPDEFRLNLWPPEQP
ncbi:MAG: serine/threonine protein kinase, partial [Planctomycetes bacterium]|nr:serine/threonine protein kinase [Planctomycetota bacterium]